MRLFKWKPATAFALEDFDESTRSEEIWVAECNNEAVGFISMWIEDNFVHNLFVHPDFTGKGIGSALLRRALARIGRPATLKCLVVNADAIDFYTSQGWCVESKGRGSGGDYFVFRI